jgi:signal peptidase II
LKTKILCLISVIFLIAADQISKVYIKAITHSSSEDSLSFIKIGGRRIIDITYCENTGAAFSIFSGKKIFLIGLTGLLMVFCLWYWLKIKDKRQIFSLTLIIAGGIGNLIDRIFRGYVVDFFEVKPFTFGIFNVADCFVVVGVCLFVLFTIIDEVREFKNRNSGEKTVSDTVLNENGKTVLNENDKTVLNENDKTVLNENDKIVLNENDKTVSDENDKTVLNENDKIVLDEKATANVPNTNIVKAVNSKNADGAKIKSALSINLKSADGKSIRYSNGVNVKFAKGIRLNCADSAELKTVNVSRKPAESVTVKPTGVRVLNLKSPENKGENR